MLEYLKSSKRFKKKSILSISGKLKLKKIINPSSRMSRSKKNPSKSIKNNTKKTSDIYNFMLY